MTNDQPTPPPSRRSLNSIGAKIMLILLAMITTTVVGGYLVGTVFLQIASDMRRMTQDNLPQLQVSSELIGAAGQSKDAMAAALLATDAEALARATGQIEDVTTQLDQVISSLSEEARADLAKDADNVRETLSALVVARDSTFRNRQWIGDRTLELQQASSALQTALSEAADSAQFNIITGGQTTISRIDATLSSLVEEQFAALQMLLETRAEVNLLSGLSLALGTTRDAGLKSILSDLHVASGQRLSGLLDDLAANEAVTLDASSLRAAVDVFGKVVGDRASGAMRRQVLQARQEVDANLSEAVDDMIFMLTIAAEEAGIENNDAIQHLLDNEVAYLDTLLEISTAISSFQVAALDLVTARTVAAVSEATAPLVAAAEHLAAFKAFDGGRFATELSRVAGLSDVKEGLPALMMASLKADAMAVAESNATLAAVLEISRKAIALGDASQSELGNMARKITNEVHEAQFRMYLLLGVAAAVFLAAMILTRFLILMPLRAISETTERLARGNLRPVEGFKRSSDEIRRIATALSVFRDSLAEKEELSKSAEAERKARAEEQAKAVTAIGAGLERLSRGDLRLRIEDDMSEGYLKLRDDFNATLDKLMSTVSSLKAETAGVRAGSDEISLGANELSNRTENQAATLEETAAALDELTASVRSAAEGARTVETTVQEARDQAQSSEEVVRNAVDAMTEIESSSREISKIVAVIDDIAFQTNLLALNAGVEAARAGEAGNGFAVVAAEVRALAQRSSESAMEIKSLIDNSSVQVERGVDLVGRAGGALGSILDQFARISDLITNIAEVAAEQSNGLNEINTGMSQLDQVTQQNAAMVQSTTKSSEVLQGNASRLSDIVAHFDVGDAGALAADEPEETEADDFREDEADQLAMSEENTGGKASWHVAPTQGAEITPAKTATGTDDTWSEF